MAGIKENSPDLAKDIESLGYAVRVLNMITEAKEIGLTVDVTSLDAETIHLVYLIKRKLKERVERKKPAKSGGAKRRGRR